MVHNKKAANCCTVIAILLIAACKNSSQNPARNHSVELSDSCLTDALHRYEVYIPSTNVRCEDMPMLLIIDPHADAKNAIKYFIPAAEKYKYILVASAKLRNNYTQYTRSITELLHDVRSKYPVSETLCIAGFSGGARIAISYAQLMPVDGLIACGALAAPEQLRVIKCPIIGVIGMADFNFIETAQYLFIPEEAPENLRIEVTDEIHGWPGSGQISNALGYIHVAHKGGNACCREKVVFRDFASDQKKRIDSLRLVGDLIGAGLIARNLASLEDFSEYDDFISIRNSIEYSTNFNSALDQLKETIRFELKMRNAYSTAILSNDLIWWENEIASLNKMIGDTKERFSSLAFKRIKGFLGIMSYSLCDNALRTNDLKNAEHLLPIYRLIEPDNADMYYDYALFYQKMNKADSISKYLQAAIDAGFSDEQKMTVDFSSDVIRPLKNPL